MNEKFWKNVIIVIWSIIIILLIGIFIFLFNKGSNADINDKPYVKISCYDSEKDFDVTWKFYKLNSTEYQNAIDFTNKIGEGNLNCTLENFELKINES